MANLVGQLGQTISSKVTGSVSNFASGAKSAFVSANPAVFGPALSGLGKMLTAQSQKERKEDKEKEQRKRGFDEENQNEQRKLFTDILGELKEQTEYLKKILEALTKDKKGFGLGSLLAALGQLAKSLIDKLKKLFDNLRGKLKGFFDDLLKFFKKIPEFFRNLLKGLDDFIKSLRLKFPKVFAFFDDIGKFFKNIFDDIKKTRIPKFKASLDNVFKVLNQFIDLLKVRFAKGLEDFRKLIRFDDALKALRALVFALALRFEIFRQSFDELSKGIATRIGSFADSLSRSVQNLFSRIAAAVDRIVPFGAPRAPSIPSAPAAPRPPALPGAPTVERIPNVPRPALPAPSPTIPRAVGEIIDVEARVIPDEVTKGVAIAEDVADAQRQAGVLGRIIEGIKGFFAGFKPLIEGPLRFLGELTDITPLVKGIARIAGPLGVIIGIFDGIRLAVDTEKLERIFGEGNVDTQQRIAGFVGGFVGSIGGLFDLLAKLMGIEIEGESIQDSLSGTIAKFTNDVFEGIQQFFLFLGTIVKSEQFQSIWSAAKDLAGKVVEGVKDLFQFMKDVFFSEPMQYVFKTLGQLLSVGLTTVINGIGNLVDLVVGLFTLDFNRVKSAGMDLIGGIVDGIGNLFAVVGNVMIDGINWLLGKLPSWVRSAMDITPLERFEVKTPKLGSNAPISSAAASTPPSSAATRSSASSRGAGGGASTSSAGYGPGANVGQLTPNAQMAFDFFVAQGMTPEQAAGFVANLQRESGANLDTRAYNAKENAMGIAQWRGDRVANFKRVFGKDIRDASLQEQLNYIMWELNNTEKKAYNQILATTTASGAAAAVDQFYERSSGAHRQERMAGANALLSARTATSGTKSPEQIAAEKQNQQVAANIGQMADNTKQSADFQRASYEASVSRVNTTADTSNQPTITVQPDTSGRKIQEETKEASWKTAENVQYQTQTHEAYYQHMTEWEYKKYQEDLRYKQERRQLEGQFYNALTNQYAQILQGLMRGSGGYGQIADPNRGAGYNLANKYLGSKLSKALGPEFGFIATQLVGSYADQFIGNTLGAFFPQGGGDAAQRVLNAYVSGDKKAMREQLIYGITGIPTGFNTLMGSGMLGGPGGFSPAAMQNNMNSLARDLSIVTGSPFESLFRIGEQAGTFTNTLLYGNRTGASSPVNMFSDAVSQFSTGTQNYLTGTQSFSSGATDFSSTLGKIDYSLTGPGGISSTGFRLGGGTIAGGGGAIPGVAGPVYYGGGGVRLGAGGRPIGSGTPTAEERAAAFGRITDLGINIGSMFAGNKLVSALGVKDPLAASFLGMAAGQGFKYLGKAAFAPGGLGTNFSLQGLQESILGGFKGMFDPTSLGTSIAKGLMKVGNNFSGTALGNVLGEFGLGMANPGSLAGQFGAGSFAGTAGALAGGLSAGFSTYGMSKMLSRGYEVKGVNEIAGVLGALNAFGAFGASSFAAGGLGGALGALGFNPIGLAILGGAVLINSLFGKKKSVVGAGIQGTLGEGTTNLVQYQDVKTSSKFGGSSTSTSTSALDPEQLKFYQETIDAIFKGVRTGAEVLDLNKEAITGFTKSVKINLQGLSNDAALKKIQDEFTKFTNEMLLAAYPDLQDFKIAISQDDKGKDVFEDAIGTFNRLVDATRFMNLQFEMLGYEVEDLAKTLTGKTALAIADFKYDLSTMFGGETYDEQQQNFAKATEAYFQMFYTQEEKLTFLRNQQDKALQQIVDSVKDTTDVLDQGFPPFGKDLEESRKIYRELVDNFVKENDMSLEANQKAFASLVAAGPLYMQAAEAQLQLAALQEKEAEKTISFEEVFGTRPSEVVSSVGYAGTLVDAGFVEGLAYATQVDDVDLSDSLTNVTTGGTPGATGEFLSVDNASRGGTTNIGGTTVVDNSVKQVSAPRTTVVMNDDKVRDYHPILHHLSRHTLAAFMPGCR